MTTVWRFVYFNFIFIITDMVASILMRTPFTLRDTLIEWVWWNIAYYLVLGVGWPIRHAVRYTVQEVRKRPARFWPSWRRTE